MKTEKLYLYEGREDVTLTTYILDDSRELLDGKKRPAVLVCPGGAYLNCSDREGEPVALRFAAMGYHAFVLRYSVLGRNAPDFNAFDFSKKPEPNPDCVYPRPQRDIARAMLTIRAHAAEWLVDADRVAICGFSAGAHNCAMYSVYWDDPVTREPFGCTAEELRPAAAILAYTLSDYVFMQGELQKMEGIGKGLFDLCNLAFLGTTDPDGATLDKVSPARHITKNTPPTFLWATAGDNLVPVQHTLLMANALATAGVPFEVHVFEEGDHGLSLADQSTAVARVQIDPDASKWVGLAEAWLQKRLALDLPDQLSWNI